MRQDLATNAGIYVKDFANLVYLTSSHKKELLLVQRTEFRGIVCLLLVIYVLLRLQQFDKTAGTVA
jgi:hypothetical protein